MPTWPATLPQDIFVGVRHSRVDAVLRSPVSVGPFKTRRRATVASEPTGVLIKLTNAQRSTFKTFYITTLKEGSDSFDWKDPIDGTTVSFAFLAPSEWTSIGVDSNGPIWQSVMSLLILP